MIIENLTTLKINQLTQAQYEAALVDGYYYTQIS